MNSDVVFKIVVQRASEAEVRIASDSCGSMGQGLVLLFGVAAQRHMNELGEVRHFDFSRDTDVLQILEKLADKILGMRIFSDAEGKMNLSVRDVNGGIYLISQFTLFADCKKGFRPGFSLAARPPFAKEVYSAFVDIVKNRAGGLSVFTGQFGADMAVRLVNDGPVTIVLEADVKGIR